MKLKNKHIKYLEKLRDSGVTNMWGAGVYLEREFVLTADEAKEILTAWIKSYKQKEERK
jgi:hypothetical protein